MKTLFFFVKTLEYFFRTVRSLLYLTVLYLFFAVLLSVLSTNPKSYNCSEKKTIYVSTNGLHSDFIIPKQYLNPKFLKAIKAKSSKKFVSFGWGDRDFYLETPTWNEAKASVILKAIFLKSESVMHIYAYSTKQNDWKKVEICGKQFRELDNYIENTFKTDSKGEFLEIQSSDYSNDDYFFMAKGSYSLFKTCNNWVNQGLKSAEVKTAIWTPFDKGVFYHIENQ